MKQSLPVFDGIVGGHRTDEPMLTNRRLRAFRTLLVHRWHAAQTIGEWFENDKIGFRFEHINHKRSLVEYVWRYGAFSELADGTGRVPHPEARSLRSMCGQLPGRGVSTSKRR